MGLFSWFKKRKLPSIEKLVLAELKELRVNYDAELANQISPAYPEIGFAIYNRFKNPFSKKFDSLLAENIHIFSSSFYRFLIQNKQKDFLNLLHLSYITWNSIVELKWYDARIEENKERNESYPYVQIDWKIEKSLERQIKAGIHPFSKLASIDICADDIVQIENNLKNYGQRIWLSAKDILKCEDENISFLIKKLYKNKEKLH